MDLIINIIATLLFCAVFIGVQELAAKKKGGRNMFVIHNQYGLQVGDYFPTREEAELFCQECGENWQEDNFKVIEE